MFKELFPAENRLKQPISVGFLCVLFSFYMVLLSSNFACISSTLFLYAIIDLNINLLHLERELPDDKT